jgi:hypothetical protein
MQLQRARSSKKTDMSGEGIYAGNCMYAIAEPLRNRKYS